MPAEVQIKIIGCETVAKKKTAVTFVKPVRRACARGWIFGQNASLTQSPNQVLTHAALRVRPWPGAPGAGEGLRLEQLTHVRMYVASRKGARSASASEMHMQSGSLVGWSRLVGWPRLASLCTNGQPLAMTRA